MSVCSLTHTLTVRSRLEVTTMAEASPSPTVIDVTGSVCSDLHIYVGSKFTCMKDKSIPVIKQDLSWEKV